MTAVPVKPELADETAVIVTWAGDGTDVGAVYTPLLSIVPFAEPPLTCHVKVELG
jgi:hypothetical protein